MKNYNTISPYAATFLEYRTANPGKCIGYEQIAVDGTVKKLNWNSFAVPPRYAIIYLESDVASGPAIRYRIDGTSPTVSIGMPKENGDAWDIISTYDLDRFRVTEVSTGNHTLNIEYYA